MLGTGVPRDAVCAASCQPRMETLTPRYLLPPSPKALSVSGGVQARALGMSTNRFKSAIAAQHDRAVAAMANELRQLVDTANAPIFGIDVNVSLSFSFSGTDDHCYFSS